MWWIRPSREILCTVGPASLSQRVISRLEDLGVSLFRINLSHTRAEDIEDVIREIRSYTRIPICLDTEGAQVRTGNLSAGSVDLREGQLVEIVRTPVSGNAESFNLQPDEVIEQLHLGDLLSIDFNSVLAQVIKKNTDAVTLKVLTGGGLGQNKAVTVDKPMQLNALTEKDRLAVEVGRRHGIKHIALSFTNGPEDVDQLRSLVGQDVFIISKIESREGVRNLRSIASRANAILIDRGDLSREVPIEQIPRAQKAIIQSAKEVGTRVYVATNLLESMIASANPTRAEVNDIFNTLLDGADGLVLAAETAIGKHPVQSALMVLRVMDQFDRFAHGEKYLSGDAVAQKSSVLVPPHGGRLVQNLVHQSEQELSRLDRIECKETVLMDAQNLGIGAYSPLDGFMSKEQFDSVIHEGRLPDGTVWPLPIVLQVSSESAKRIVKGQQFALVLEGTLEVYATLDVSEVYSINLAKACTSIFGIDDDRHPGVRQFRTQGEWVVAGKVSLVKRLPLSDIGHHFALTPSQIRKVFEHKGWCRVGGFHTRNVCHRAHEFIQLRAMQDGYFDGLLIHPLVGSSRSGDYLGAVILDSYQVAIEHYYPHEKIVLAAFHNYPRFAGPREALFTALCRKNFGCSHFIVGRDHSGVGNYYARDAAQKTFEQAGDIGIEPVFVGECRYDKASNTYVFDQAGEMAARSISGSEAREMLKAGTTPPDWFMREEVSAVVLGRIRSGEKVFVQ